MKNTWKKIKKENWHKHAGYSALIALLFHIFAIDGTYSPLIPALASGAFFAFVGVFWEGINELRGRSFIDWRDIAANFVGAFVVVFLYHWIF